MLRQDNDMLPHGDYLETLTVWQIRNGLNSMDLTPAQTERYRAFERSGGDVHLASRMVFERRMYRRDPHTAARVAAFPELDEGSPL